jgi:hypothetical protein
MIIFLLSFREREQKNVYRLIEKGEGGEPVAKFLVSKKK